MCRGCALEIGRRAWCDGHHDEADTALRWARSLPAHWDLAVTLWWVATGEIGLDSLVEIGRDRRLPDRLRRTLPDPG